MTAPAVPETEPHIRAVQAAVTAALPTSVKFALGKAPDGSPPYVVGYPDPGDVQSARLAAKNQRITIYWMVHAIGTGPEQAYWAMDKARAAFLGAAPVVAGRHVYPLVQSMNPPPLARDDDVFPPLFVAVAEFELRSDPA